ncbi:MAG: sortase [Patescibacteria group bacterium]|nr:sortase [Patescibacteria group bacterium]
MKNLPNILAFVGFAVICAIAFLSPKEQVEVAGITQEIPEKKEDSYPVKISIESIGVNAPIESVGILDGAMAVPTFGHNVGWYSLGTRPGEVGSAVLAGHVNWMNGEDAVFTNLKNIKIGDTISVTNNYGQIVHFAVTDIQSFPLYTDTTEIFSSSDGIVRLNLITCNGSWSDWLNTHDSRLVVFAEKIY